MSNKQKNTTKPKRAKYVHVKSQGTAIILALFFGCFAWIYTWKYDAWKFVGCLLLNLLLFWTVIIPLMTWLWALIDALSKPKALFEDYYK